MSGLINNYTPFERVKSSKSKLFSILMKLLEKGDEIPKTPIIDMLFSFISSEEQLASCIDWMQAQKILLPSGQTLELSKKNQHSILLNLFRSKAYTIERKQELMQQILGDD